MYLECFTNVCHETCHYPVSWTYAETGITPKVHVSELQTHKVSYEYWIRLINTYSALALTKVKDRLPALSGLASSFQLVSPSPYLAGLWLKDLPGGLAWYVPPRARGETISASARQAQYVAPSWSIAATLTAPAGSGLFLSKNGLTSWTMSDDHSTSSRGARSRQSLRGLPRTTRARWRPRNSRSRSFSLAFSQPLAPV